MLVYSSFSEKKEEKRRNGKTIQRRCRAGWSFQNRHYRPSKNSSGWALKTGPNHPILKVWVAREKGVKIRLGFATLVITTFNDRAQQKCHFGSPRFSNGLRPWDHYFKSLTIGR